MKRRFIIRNDKNAYSASAFILGLPTDGTKEVIIKEHKTTRSLEQNSLYWIWVGILADELGYTKDSLHDALRDALLEPVSFIDVRSGETKSRLRSTTELSVKEFTAYLEAVEVFASDFAGCVLPRPEEQYAIAMGYRRVNERAKRAV